MNKDFTVKKSVLINAPAERVWDALVDPAMVKQYLFGTDIHTDWKVGSPIIYTGVWEGKSYEDKGTILDIVPGKLLKTTYWSSMSGQADEPQNYKNVTYELATEKHGTRFTVTQDNNASLEEKNHTEQNWGMVLNSLKELLEKQKG
jgi:uncharacterized protein YndB with AHSA1/START domain